MPARLNILIVTGIFPPDIGGPATYVPAMGNELAKRGHRVTVVTLSDGTQNRENLYLFSVVRIPRRTAKLMRLLLAVAAILREGRGVDVLLVNGLYLEAVLANLFLRKPLVQKLVGDWAWERATIKGWVSDTFEEFHTRKYDLKVEALKRVRNFYVRHADALIVPSRYLAHWIGFWGRAKKKISVIYNAVELPACSPAVIPLSTRIKIVTVGRLVPWKQVDRLIKAVAQCEGTGLVIVGDGPDRNRLEQLVRGQALSDRVYFAGQRKQEETVSLMAACDLFVLNSTYEGLPHVVLEAMGAGLPVVATAVGGTPEIVKNGKNGILLRPDANGLLSETIAKLVSSSAERERLAMGAKQTAHRFRRSRMIDETEAVLEACAHTEAETWTATHQMPSKGEAVE